MADEKRRHWTHALVRPAIDLIVDGTKAAYGHRVLALGASGVGKTTLWTYLEKGGAAAAADIDKTLEPYKVGNGRFKVRDVHVVGIKVRLRAVDVPGDVELRTHWGEVLSSLSPRAVIFMLDHAMDGQELDKRGVNADRMNEHREAFSEFCTIVQANSEIRKSLRALAIMANKSDVWPRHLTYGQLLQHSGVSDKLRDLKEGLSTHSASTSAKYGQGIRPTVEWIVRSV
jgi:broad-specificity NMP kinase